MTRRAFTLLVAVPLLCPQWTRADESTGAAVPAKTANAVKSSSAAAQARDPEASLNWIKRRLERELIRSKIAAAVVVENGTLVVSQNTRKFAVHSVSPTGVFSDQSSEVTGPLADGFLVRIQVADDASLRARKPQTLVEPYWTTQVSMLPFSLGENGLLVHFSYGAKIDQKAREEIVRAIDMATMMVCQRQLGRPPLASVAVVEIDGR